MSTAAKLSLVQKNPLTDKQFLNAFIEGVTKTLSLLASTKITTGKASVEKNFSSNSDVAGMVGMVGGGLKGTLTISFSKECILQIYENMLGEKLTEINKDISDSVGELTNQIYGDAKTTLNKMGYSLDMAIPTVIEGSFRISQYHTGATLSIPFMLSDGKKFSVEITVQA